MKRHSERRGLMVLYVVLAVLAVLTTAVLLGPRIRFRPTGVVPEVPADAAQLTQWIADGEVSFPDVIDGAQKEIVWADPDRRSRTGYVVVYLHGFSASRREIHPFAQIIADGLGANAFYTRLTGHGRTNPDAMGQMEPDDWYNDAVEALAVGQAIGERIVLVATSTGVTLATVLVEQFPQQIHALVAVSPNYGPTNKATWLTAGPWGEQIGNLVMDEYLSWQPGSEMHGRYWTMRYPNRAIPVMMSLVAYGRRIRHRDLVVPMIQFSSPRDNVVDYDWSIKVFDRWGTAATPAATKELVLVEDSTDGGQHVITGEIRSPENTGRLAALAVEFLRGLQ